MAIMAVICFTSMTFTESAAVHDQRVLKVASKRSGSGGEYSETIARVCSDVSLNLRQK
jgi:hypothetical protein